MFSLEKLIVAISEDVRSPYDVLKQILPMLDKIVQNEKQNREAIYNIGIKVLINLFLFNNFAMLLL